MVLIHYGLRFSPTNKMYAVWNLERFFRQNNMFYQNETIYVHVPAEVYERVKTLNDSFRNKREK